MDTVFLDANILFSAARRLDSRLRRLWDLPNARLVTSVYAGNEARRHLVGRDQRQALADLLARMRIVVTRGRWAAAPAEAAALPTKDRPILRGALEAGATHLLTGDRRHFGAFYGQRIEGVLVLPPAAYLDPALAADEAPEADVPS